MSTPPELLAPAGDWETVRAACANGANAIYIGLSGFNARYRATNFTPDELPEVVRFLHDRNVRCYVAFNTLIFSDELEDAAKALLAIAAAGVDAVIVQDVGIALLCRQLVPDLAVHASTQMTLTEPTGINFVARELSIQRVILARELSVKDIGKIAAATPMPLEVFVHGALCVAYSGQCLTSEALGGRSANRGQCAQACRLPYQMLVDGQNLELGDRAYLLSPQDLAAYDLIEPLLAAGVSSFKIEGRLKGGPYVAMTTQTYRAAIDKAVEGTVHTLTERERLDLEQTFSRGLTHGFLDGNDHQMLVQGRFPKSRGVKVGVVVGRTREGVLVELASTLPDLVRPGDGVVFDEGHPEQEEKGGRLFAVTARAQKAPKSGTTGPVVELAFARDGVRPDSIQSGSLVWKTDDPVLKRRLERTYAQDKPRTRRAVDIHASGRPGEALVLRATAGEETAVARWEGPLVRAEKHPLTIELLREQLGRLGETAYQLDNISLDAPEPVLVPKSILNELRRELVKELDSQPPVPRAPRATDPSALPRLRHDAGKASHRPSVPAQLTVLVRNLEQLDAVLAWKPGVALVYCDFEDVRRYAEAVARARAANVKIGLAGIRIIKPGEEGLLRQLAGFGADALLVRNLAGLTTLQELAKGVELVGDFSLNVANELTARFFTKAGLTRVVPSFDLNWEQLSSMLRRSDPGVYELVVHQHIPMFHMEHCVFAAFLSEGKDHRDCGRPCDRHKVELKDRVGAQFPVLADVGCRNTVFNSVAQSAAEYVPQLLAAGVSRFRVDLLRETAIQVAPLLDRYARVVSGQDDGREIWKQLRVLNQLGVTRGTLRVI